KHRFVKRLTASVKLAFSSSSQQGTPERTQEASPTPETLPLRSRLDLHTVAPHISTAYRFSRQLVQRVMAVQNLTLLHLASKSSRLPQMDTHLAVVQASPQPTHQALPPRSPNTYTNLAI